MALPEGWSSATLPDLISSDGLFSDGDWVESKDQDPDGDVRLIQLADIGDGFFRNRSSRFLTSSKAAELNCTFLKPGDILVARMPEPLGRACIFPGDPKKAVTVVDICVIRLGTKSANPRWVPHVINSPQFRESLDAHVKGTTRRRISRSNLAGLQVAVPPLAEQGRMVKKIEALLARVDASRGRLIASLTTTGSLEQSILNAAYSGSILGKETSECLAFGEICTELRGGNSATSQRSPTPWPVLKSSAVRPFEIDYDDLNYLGAESDVSANAEIHENDLLITRLSGSIEYVGNCAVVQGRPQKPLQIPDRIFRARLKPGFNERYVEIMFNAPEARKPLEDTAKSSAGHQRISLSDVRAVQIPRLPWQEQLEVVRHVDAVWALAKTAENRVRAALARADKLTQSILAKAFAGELVPTEAELARREGRDYEPASVLLDRIRKERPLDKKPARSSRRPRSRG